MGQSQSTSSRYESNEVMPPNASTASTTLFHTGPKKKYMLVAAIDLGTSYSGFAFSFMTDFTKNPNNCYVPMWESSYIVNYQAPTNILIEKKGEITKAIAFGYDAESTYAKASNDDKKSLYLFQRFKMSLDVESGLNKDVMVKDVLGKSLSAMTVFSLSIGCLKRDIEQVLNKDSQGQNVKPSKIRFVLNKGLHGQIIKPSEILWVLTIPTKWNDAAKQFMREAAIQAGIPNNQLELVQEPEAASVLCRHLENTVCGNAKLSDLKTGDQYMVLDAGGGTVDVTIHEVVNRCAVKEVIAASSGAWGGVKVDNRIFDLLEKITGHDFLMALKEMEYSDYADLVQDFEVLKRKMKPDQDEPMRIRLPICSFNEICMQFFGEDFATRLQKSNFGENVTLKRGCLYIQAHIFKDLFKEAINDITNHVKSLVDKQTVFNCKHILMVGGFSDSSMLQEAVKKACPKQNVIIPVDAGLMVVKGAVAFGHDPSVISQRISKYTYGTDTIEDFRSDEHSKRFMGFYCRDIFRPFVKASENLRVGQPSNAIEVTPFLGFLRTRMTINLYAMEGGVPKFVTDEGCKLVGQIVVPMGMLHSNKRVQVQLLLGGTELQVQCTYMNTGEITLGSIDFLQ